MPLLYLLPVITAIAFFISVYLTASKSKGKSGKYVFLFIMMIGTGLVYSLIEAIIIRIRFGYDNAIILDKLVFFILAIVVNSLNCLGKGYFVRKEFMKENSDYTGAVSRANILDTLGLVVMIVVLLMFK